MLSFNKVFNDEEKKRLKQLIEEGDRVLQEVETLNTGLKETVKAVGEEMDIKPSLLMKAVRTAHKAQYHDEYYKFDALQTILESTGHTL